MHFAGVHVYVLPRAHEIPTLFLWAPGFTHDILIMHSGKGKQNLCFHCSVL